MAIDPVFPNMEDTPMFRQRVTELENNFTKLRSKCNSLLTSSRKYKDALGAMLQAQNAFAAAMTEFCGASDTEFLGPSAAPLSKFISVFKDLSSYYELLRVQVDVSLCETLQSNWLEGNLQQVKDAHKQYDRKLSDHESARMKYLALKKVTKKEVLDKAQYEMNSTKVLAEQARFEMARKLSEVDSQKSYAFLEAMVSNIHAHLKFFANGHTLFQKLEPTIQESMDAVEQLKTEGEERMAQLDVMITNYKVVVEQREQKVLEISAAGEAAISGVGPLQMSATSMGLNQEIEHLIKTTKMSGGSQVTIIKQGYLFKKNSGSRLADWKRRFFVLDSQGMLYYYSHKESFFPALLRQQKETPQNTVNLLTSTIKLDDEDGNMRFCFRVISPAGLYTLQAENELERQEWVEAIQGVINCLLNGTVSPSDMPKKPVRATHSRSNSVQDMEMNLSPQRGTTFSTVMSGFPLLEVPSSQAFSTLERLRRVAGNRQCVDCNANDPDWASLNLGVMLCIECSGIHRQLGVHISKVRSCTLDVNVWVPPIMQVFEVIGNEYSNQVWEVNLSKKSQKADSWVWCDESDDDDESGALARKEQQLSQRVLVEETVVIKPSATTPLSEKQKYIVEKYVNRAFVEALPKATAQALLWDGVEATDVRMLLRALAVGADFGHLYNHARAKKLAAEAQAAATGQPLNSIDQSGHANVTALHLACTNGDSTMLEFLLQNGAPFDSKDVHNRTPLHYSILYDKQEAATMLLKRGANPSLTDINGQTAMDLAMSKGRISDDELFLLLSKRR